MLFDKMQKDHLLGDMPGRTCLAKLFELVRQVAQFGNQPTDFLAWLLIFNLHFDAR